MTLAEKLQRLRLPTMSPECNPSPRRWPTSQELAHVLQGIAGHF
jgi:hypothetical protein